MWRLLLLLAPVEALADSVVATRTIPAREMLRAEDVTLVEAEIPGALEEIALAVGQEARVAIYAGRAVRAADLGPGTIVERNQMVVLSYQTGALAIVTEGRALDRGAEGDVIAVMNMASRTTIFGLIGPDGVVRVGPAS